MDFNNKDWLNYIKRKDLMNMDFEERWNTCFQIVKYYKEKTNYQILETYFMHNDIRIGRWLDTQRNMQKNEKMRPDRKQLLESIHMIWNKFNDQWEYKYQLCKQFFDENGHIFFSANFKIQGVNIGMWLSDQRKALKNESLSVDRKNKLDSISMVWDEKEYVWENMYLYAKEYYKKYHNLEIPKRYVIHEVALGNWISTQRSVYMQDKLDNSKILKLESIGMVWYLNSQIQTSFNEQTIFFYLKKYFPIVKTVIKV